MAQSELYNDFFGFSERPFTLLPDPDMIYWSPLHKRSYNVLQYGVFSRAPILLVTGEIGAGKTTLIQNLLRELDQDQTAGLISNAQGGRAELLAWVLGAFDLPRSPDQDYVSQVQMFHDFLLEEYAAGRRVILIVDEAQNLTPKGLEEIRMLTNINSGKDELIQLILVGQPELRDMVRAPDMKQLAQRTTATIHLTALDQAHSAEYIQHRLRVAGGSGDEITPDAITAIHLKSGGVPRVINQLCDLVLLYAWGSDHNPATRQDVQAVLSDDIFLGTTASEPTS